jgi:hypothetical protein
MALLNCKECGKEISSEAMSCPHCGARLQKSKNGCGIAALIVFGLIAVMVVISGIGNRIVGDETADNACTEAHILVSHDLVAPGSADFSYCSNDTAKKGSDGIWSVAGYVDSQNAFGAKLRSSFLVQLRYDAGVKQWRRVSVEIE